MGKDKTATTPAITAATTGADSGAARALVTLERERCRALLARFARCRIMVVGDLMLDRYVWGRVDRISPEAPVPVVQVENESAMLGGAGNVVRNLVSLGAQVDVVATVGQDDAARELSARLDHLEIWNRQRLVERFDDQPFTDDDYGYLSDRGI